MRYLLVAWFCLLLVGGCATTSWSPVGGAYTSGPQNFAVTLPEGWMRAGTDEPMIITRDGVLLQNIRVERISIDKDLKNTKKKLTEGMRALETAEIILDDLSSDQSMVNVTVIESAPATVGGYAGFRTVFTFRNAGSLRMKSIYYGALVKKSFYCMRYTAAERHYFDKDVETFEKVYKSFKIQDI